MAKATQKIDESTWVIETWCPEHGLVTLPVLSEGRVYISIARDLAIKLGCGVGMRTFHPADHTDAIRDGTYAYGLRQCGGDGGAKGKDALDNEKRNGVIERCDAIDDGTHVYGTGGGGSALSTYIVVLRENVIAALVALGQKKADVLKGVTADPEKAYLKVSATTAGAMRRDATDEDKPKITTESVHAILWKGEEAEAKTEAARRDKAKGQVKMSQAMRDAVLALATSGVSDEMTAQIKADTQAIKDLAAA